MDNILAIADTFSSSPIVYKRLSQRQFDLMKLSKHKALVRVVKEVLQTREMPLSSPYAMDMMNMVFKA